MYTSGSTGTPKGLMHTHHSGRAYAVLSAAEYGVEPSDRLGNHSPLHFDMSTFEMLTGPLCGATTVLIPEAATMFPRSLAELIERERLTFWYSVPLALIQLLQRGGVEERDCSSLRWVLFGGEPFPPKHLARLMELWPHARFSNSYGPAEVNQCTAYHVPKGPLPLDEPLPIGPVWRGAQGLVVDADDGIVEPGRPGELLIRAPTMMAGYWGRPDLDEHAFFRRSARSGLEELFYRTGDLVREGEGGNLQFLGRKDRQIKVRGHRVELDEIEALLTAQDGVAEAAAVDLRDEDGAASIAAAARLRDGARVDAEACAAPWHSGCRPTLCRRDSRSSTSCRAPAATRSTGRPCAGDSSPAERRRAYGERRLSRKRAMIRKVRKFSGTSSSAGTRRSRLSSMWAMSLIMPTESTRPLDSRSPSTSIDAASTPLSSTRKLVIASSIEAAPTAT